MTGNPNDPASGPAERVALDAVTATQAKHQMGHLLDRVEHSRERIAITRLGRTVAWLVPAGPAGEPPPGRP